MAFLPFDNACFGVLSFGMNPEDFNEDVQLTMILLSVEISSLRHLVLNLCESENIEFDGKSAQTFLQEYIEERMQERLRTLSDTNPNAASALARLYESWKKRDS